MAARGGHLQPQFRGQLGIRRLDQKRVIFENDRGDDALAVISGDHVRLARLVFLDVDPVIGNLMFAQKLFTAAAIGAPVRAIQGDMCLSHNGLL